MNTHFISLVAGLNLRKEGAVEDQEEGLTLSPNNSPLCRTQSRLAAVETQKRRNLRNLPLLRLLPRRLLLLKNRQVRVAERTRGEEGVVEGVVEGEEREEEEKRQVPPRSGQTLCQR